MDGWTPEDRRRFGKRLAEAREAKGLLQADIGAMFGKLKQTVSSWERGLNLPNAEEVARLADEFGVPVDWLLTGQRPAWPFPGIDPARFIDAPAETLLRAEGALLEVLRAAPAEVSKPEPQHHSREYAERAIADLILGIQKGRSIKKLTDHALTSLGFTAAGADPASTDQPAPARQTAVRPGSGRR